MCHPSFVYRIVTINLEKEVILRTEVECEFEAMILTKTLMAAGHGEGKEPCLRDI